MTGAVTPSRAGSPALISAFGLRKPADDVTGAPAPASASVEV
ncbi:hypothetical protein OG739_30530 [Streptomyces longwoodensis]|nr:hypothetical protein [Streptomyces longwoodensis]WRY91692.1 hypothetical protein OG481_25680 [Streptomyces longwoodensis]WUC56792.1 hypothetical protein OHA09_06675 [Streptomyces longwoodensis]WUC70314.1 hypothetical protein OG416_05630 [Streptomyces longwoodensis]